MCSWLRRQLSFLFQVYQVLESASRKVDCQLRSRSFRHMVKFLTRPFIIGHLGIGRCSGFDRIRHPAQRVISASSTTKYAHTIGNYWSTGFGSRTPN
ncbi:hypothetical protein LX32DRAFT_89984 [Colletotrichum zoysiae]|uniref:Uncharacterized protein n=1 Tax=Colletotrichum zoysiae TaxID=1216348 RepID=A0AAD9HQY4_9PEZI|nr:hypothetical protein LX32DRAFT_89984 [Colletotrichum zoysiae]